MTFDVMLHNGVSGLALLLVPSWPLLAACLLALIPRVQLTAAATSLSVAGLALTALLTPLLPGQDMLADIARLLAAATPLLARREGLSRIAAIVPLLATSCVMAALTLHGVLPVVALLGFAAALLALHDASAAARARAAWETARLRLAGAMLALLGATFGTGLVDISTSLYAAATLRTGDLLLAVGLCLLAGLGQTIRAPETGRAAWLDMLSRLAAVALMLRLPEGDVTQMVFLTAGLTTLWLCVLTRHGGPALFTALATLCAASDHGVGPALICLIAGVGSAALAGASVRAWFESALPPSPLFIASMALLAGIWPKHPVASCAALLALGIQAARVRVAWPTQFDARRDAVSWMLIALGLIAPFLLRWPASWLWPLAWRPS